MSTPKRAVPSIAAIETAQPPRRRRAAAGGVALVLLGLAGAEPAGASGYALREQSTSALGNAFAGATAGADDLSYMFFNPAGMTRQEGSQIVAGGSAILPQLKIRNQEGTSGLGTPTGGNTGGSNAAVEALVPFVYGMVDVQRDFGVEQNVKFGVALTVPFALATHYNDGWTGRYYALESQIQTINLMPAVAWEVLDGVSVGGGLQVQYMSARLTNALDFGSIGQAVGIPGAVPTQQDGEARVSGNDVGYGYNLGLLVEPWEGGRVGAAYRSSIHQTLRGNARFRLDDDGVGAALRSGGAFQNGNVNADVTTPESVSFGVHHQITDEWAVMGEAQWTRWSRFQDITLKFNNPAEPDSVTEQDWNDTWFFAAGVTWRPVEAWTFRAGAAFDEDPIPNNKRTPRIPTDDRYWLTIGVAYKPYPNLSIDFGFSHIFAKDASINLKASQQPSPFQGSFSGNAALDANILSIQALWKF